MVVAIPDPLAEQQIVEQPRIADPALGIVVRTHSWTERTFLAWRGIGKAMMGEPEIVVEMARHTPSRFECSNLKSLAARELRARAAPAAQGFANEGATNGRTIPLRGATAMEPTRSEPDERRGQGTRRDEAPNPAG